MEGKVLVGVTLVCFMLFDMDICQKRDTDKEKYKMETPFRINKLNLLWQKAMKRHTSNKMADLYADLKFQDKLELEAKKKTAEGFDPDGSNENFVRRKFFAIMDSYELRETLSLLGDEDFGYTGREENPIPLNSEPKMDPKLAKFWKQAQFAGLDDDELVDLKTELEHHQLNVDEYNLLKNDIDAMNGVATNEIEEIKANDFEERSWEDKNRKLKDSYSNMKDGYERLELMAKKKFKNIEDSGQLEFTEPKVYDLWVTALKGNFTSYELESLKNELQHFEHKVKKHEHIKQEVRLSEVGMKEAGNKFNNDMPDKHKKLQQKEKDYAHRVKKYHSDLRYRIEKQMLRHSEL